jgi:hypothetical protein
MLFMHANTVRDPLSDPANSRYLEATLHPFLIDIDLLFRLPLIPRLLLNAGAGLTFECMYYTVSRVTKGVSGSQNIDSGFDGSQPGYNIKIGVEFFLDAKERLSVTADSTLQYWRSGFGKEKFRIYIVSVGLAYCL